MKPDRCFILAMRENGKVNPNFQKMKIYFEKSYKEGNFKSAYALGTWYLHGFHVKRNLKLGIKLIRTAAKANVPEALYDLAVSYETGEGAKKTLRLAYESYLRAALAGDKQSIYEVGRCHFYGIGIARNRRIGWIWIDKAEQEGIKE